MERKKSFLIYFDQEKQISLLQDAEAGRLFKALFQFAVHGETPIFEDGMTQMCFSFISAQIERDVQRYEEKCKRNAENAKKTNASKNKQALANASDCIQTQANVSDRMRSHANGCYIDKDIEKETDTDIDIGIDTGTDTGTDTEIDIGTDTGTVRGIETERPQKAPPCAPRPCPTAPPMTEEERDRLVSKGIPAGYVDERRERANLYAAQHGKSAYDTLLGWWHNDRTQPPWNRSQTQHYHPTQYDNGTRYDPWATSQFSTNSFDTDDFFQAALARSERETLNGEPRR